LLLLVLPATTIAQGPTEQAEAQRAATARGVEIVQHGGYPELRVDGVPFFVHSAAFFYYRIPRDLWEASLEQHRRLGINTLDLYIPWNWHEARAGQFDFDGRTNPRRDLRGLLSLIAEKGFKVIARPGPVILNEWRHGGYPEWLLERPEYGMALADRLEGRYAPLSNLNARDAEAAAKGWMENAIHLAYARKWLGAVARELAPYSSRRPRASGMPTTRPGEKKDNTKEKQTGGPLLFVQLDDDLAIGRTNNAGPAFWRYVEELRGMLEAGGLDVPFYINPTDMRVSAAGAGPDSIGAGLERPIGVMGQWYLPPPAAPSVVAPSAKTAPEERKLTAQDASNLEFFVETLKTQPAFPPVIIEYQAGWYTPGDDARPLESSVANTLLSSRLLLAHGLHGLNYFPAQDTLFPAGHETPWTNRHYRWDAALDISGNRQRRARGVLRNAQLLEIWGQFLAAAHKRADFGIVYPLGSYPQEQLSSEDILLVSATVMRLERLAQLAGLASELLDPHYQPVEQLLRHALVLLPVFDSDREKFSLSEKAQRALVEYVRRGGTLVYFPARPAGRILEQLWTSSPMAKEKKNQSLNTEDTEGHREHGGQPGKLRADTAPEAKHPSRVPPGWDFGKGHVVEFSKDFYSWVALDETFADNRARFEAAWATQALRGFLDGAGVRPAIAREPGASASGKLVVTQLVSNAGTGALGARSGGRGLVSVTNLSYDKATEETVQILSPRAGAQGTGDEFLALAVLVPPRESLLLPLHYPLCSAAKPNETCDDEVIIAGAELLRAERDGKTLELTFYTPARATARLQLESQPRRVELDEMKPEAKWTPAKRQLEATIFRGASPEFLRTLRVHLPYTPRVPEKPDLRKRARRDYEYSVADAVRLPLAEDSSLPSDPPLVVLDQNRNGQLLFEARNYDEIGRGIEVRIEGSVRGSATISLDGGEFRQAQVDLKASKEPATAGNAAGESPGGLLRGELQVRSGSDRRSSAMVFAVVPEEAVASYEFDFDRDGASEWVLENTRLRLIVSPEAGGRALALVDKASGLNLTTNVGALRDHFAFAENPEGIRPERARGRYGMFNRPYRAEWIPKEKNTALRLSYDAPDVYPAGARIEKTVRLAGPESVEVDYRVSLGHSGEGRAAGTGHSNQAQAFIAVNSLPAFSRGDRSTRFCWALEESAADKMHCETFVPAAAPVEVPETVTRVEVRTPGRSGVALEWEAGKMTVEMKQFSALLKLQFPRLVPGGAAGDYRVKCHVLAGE